MWGCQKNFPCMIHCLLKNNAWALNNTILIKGMCIPKKQHVHIIRIDSTQEKNLLMWRSYCAIKVDK